LKSNLGSNSLKIEKNRPPQQFLLFHLIQA
jgi:hypothetical protein